MTASFGGSRAMIVGGGVIGLTLALELRRRGWRVTLRDRMAFGRQASWAGAGIIAPAAATHAITPLDRLRAESYARLPALAERVGRTTGIDVGFRRCGGLEFFSSGTPPIDDYRAAGVRCEPISPHSLKVHELSLRTTLPGLHLPDVCQIRNPRLLQGLVAACESEGVELRPHDELRDVAAALADADHVVLTAGAWSAALAQQLNVSLPVRPVRGQIVALQTTPGLLTHVVEVGKRYLVPRDDGVVLIGSTEEDVGFSPGTTPQARDELLRFGCGLLPALADADPVGHWSGLRPAPIFVGPILGRVPGHDRVWLATGHYRTGIQLAAGSAELLADWIEGRPTFAAESDFSLTADRTGYRVPFVN